MSFEHWLLVTNAGTIALLGWLALRAKTYMDGYLTEKGKNLATKEDFARVASLKRLLFLSAYSGAS